MVGKKRQAFPSRRTFVNGAYQHVLAWRDALAELGMDVPVRRPTVKVGMNGGLVANALVREKGNPFGAGDAALLRALHDETYHRRNRQVQVLPGAAELLAFLTQRGVP